MKAQRILASMVMTAAVLFSIAPQAWGQGRVIDPTQPPYSAACDGTTDDTGAFRSAIRDAGSGGGIQIPVGKLCNVTSLTLPVYAGFTIFSAASPTEPSPSRNPTGIQFTGTPSACSNGTGGLLNTNNVASLLIQKVGLYEMNTSGPSNCFLNIYNSARVRFIQDYISGAANSGTIALYLQNDAQVEMRQNTFDNNVFGQHVLVPNTTNNFMPALIITNNRFGPLAFAYHYNYEVDLELVTNGASYGGKAIDISDNVFELGPNYLKIADGVGLGVTNNWTGDALPLDKWYPNTPKNANTCVTPTNYTGTTDRAGTPYTFCTSAAGTTGGNEPNWNTTPGSTSYDNDISWINEGPGIAFDLDMTGTVSGNQVAGNVAVGIKLEANSARAPAAYGSAAVFGNNLFGALWTDLWDLANGSSVFSNTMQASNGFPALTSLVQVGVTYDPQSTPVGNVSIGPNKYGNTTGNNTPFILLGGNTHGTLVYDTSQWPNSKLVDNSDNGWVISDPGGAAGVVPGTLKFTGGLYAGTYQISDSSGDLSTACAGKATLSWGTATVTNGCITASSVVLCTDQTAANAVQCTPSAGSLTIAGTGSDIIAWGRVQ